MDMEYEVMNDFYLPQITNTVACRGCKKVLVFDGDKYEEFYLVDHKYMCGPCKEKDEELARKVYDDIHG